MRNRTYALKLKGHRPPAAPAVPAAADDGGAGAQSSGVRQTGGQQVDRKSGGFISGRTRLGTGKCIWNYA